MSISTFSALVVQANQCQEDLPLSFNKFTISASHFRDTVNPLKLTFAQEMDVHFHSHTCALLSQYIYKTFSPLLSLVLCVRPCGVMCTWMQCLQRRPEASDHSRVKVTGYRGTPSVTAGN